MKIFAGLGDSQSRIMISILDERGIRVWQSDCLTEPRVIAQTLAKYASSFERIGLESGPLTPWLVHELDELGLPIIWFAVPGRQLRARR